MTESESSPSRVSRRVSEGVPPLGLRLGPAPASRRRRLGSLESDSESPAELSHGRVKGVLLAGTDSDRVESESEFDKLSVKLLESDSESSRV